MEQPYIVSSSSAIAAQITVRDTDRLRAVSEPAGALVGSTSPVWM